MATIEMLGDAELIRLGRKNQKDASERRHPISVNSPKTRIILKGLDLAHIGITEK
jgi:ribosomal protein L6P/L9E